MDEAKRELIRAWLYKARNDLESARHLGALAAGPRNTAIYHCQQAAEKAIKGFLAFRDHPLERSHDLEKLISLAAEYESAFVECEDSAIQLTPYATAYRYPGESAILEPSRAELAEAFILAEALFQFVCSRLPQDLLPGREQR